MMTPASTSTRRRPEARADELLDAAQALVLEKGLSRLTIDDVTERAGVAKGTFYLYYESKDRLVSALVERHLDGLIGHAQAALDEITDDADLWGLVDRLCEAMTDYELERADLTREMFHAGTTKEAWEPCWAGEQRIRDVFEAGIKLGQGSGAVEVGDAEVAAALIMYGCEHTVRAWILAGREAERDRLVLAQQEMIRKVLAPKG